MPIRARIALFGAGVVTTALVLFGALLFLLSAIGNVRRQDGVLVRRGEQAVAALQAAPTQPSGPALAPIDLRTSTDTFVEVLDPSGTPLSGGAVLDGRLPSFPAAVMAKAGANGSTVTTVMLATGVKVRVYVRRWSRPDQSLFGYYIVAGQSTRELSNQLSGLVAVVVISAVVTLVAGLAATWWVSGRALRPLREVARTADEIGDTEDLSRRLAEPKQQDEIGRLTRSFNAMLERLQEASGRLAEAYRRVAAALEAEKQFVSDASHELRTPLTTIRSNAGFLLSGREIQPDDRLAALQDIAAEADRMSRLVQDLLTLARADAGQHLARAPLDLTVLAASVVRQAARRHPDRAIELEAPAPLTVCGDADALTQLLWILLDNAVKHTRRGGHITVRLKAQDGSVVAEVIDDGEGIPPADLERIFERFYQANRARGGGAGLGLAIARWIVLEHGGCVSAHNNPGGGATFTVRLPST